ncbi:MAG: RsmE family RNA methyltransferase [Gemmatimonadaceae bacterium]
MEHGDHAPVATFFSSEPLIAGRVVTLDEDEAHHARVRRVPIGAVIRVIDGAGAVAVGTLARLAKAHATVQVDAVVMEEAAPEIHLLVPIADRDRMLWLAEKTAELSAASWRPVLWHRSRSVSPRGEGLAFQARVRARMTGALKQCGGSWLPAMHPDAPLERAIAAAPAGARWLLDAAGAPAHDVTVSAPLTLVLGPEGGPEVAERAALVAAGFAPVSISAHTLRFETAGIAALAMAHAALSTSPEGMREL